MGLLSNLLNDNSGKKAAGSVSDMEQALASDRWITIHPHGFLQGEGEDETKQYYRRIFIDDDGNIEKGIGKGHNIKDLSKVMKKEKEGTEGKEPGKEKGASGLNTLQDKIKAIIDDGTPYNEEKAQKVGDIMRQELEKNEKFVDLMRRLELVKKYKEVASKADYDIGQNEEYKKAQDALGDYRLQYIKEHWADDSYNINLRKDPEYIRLRNDVERFREKAILEKKNKIAEQLNMNETDRDFVRDYREGDRKVSKEVIDIFREQFQDVINFNESNNIKCSKAQKENVMNGLACYSQEFVNALKNTEVKTLRQGARAYQWLNTVNFPLQATYGTVAHEFAHAIEDSVPGIKQIEKEFYDRRTKGEKAEFLGKLTGQYGYSRKEIAKPDKFLDPYMGKDYSNSSKNPNYELLSMGMSYLYNKPDQLVKDKDYMNFVLGCLAYR